MMESRHSNIHSYHVVKSWMYLHLSIYFSMLFMKEYIGKFSKSWISLLKCSVYNFFAYEIHVYLYDSIVNVIWPKVLLRSEKFLWKSFIKHLDLNLWAFYYFWHKFIKIVFIGSCKIGLSQLIRDIIQK